MSILGFVTPARDESLSFWDVVGGDRYVDKTIGQLGVFVEQYLSVPGR